MSLECAGNGRYSYMTATSETEKNLMNCLWELKLARPSEEQCDSVSTGYGLDKVIPETHIPE